MHVPVLSADVFGQLSNVCLENVKFFALVGQRLLKVDDFINQHLLADLMIDPCRGSVVILHRTKQQKVKV